MVMNKTRFSVLFVHVTIHFLVSLVFVMLFAVELWRFLLLLMVIHFLIETGKNYLNKVKPNWVVGPYFFDQFLHVISILFIAFMMANFSGLPPFALKPLWLIILIAYLLVTYVWYITERIIAFKNAAYFQQVVDKAWPRMLARAALLSLLLASWKSISSSNWLILGFLKYPYQLKAHGMRAFFTDLVISSGGAFFVLLIV
jgi:hypothetical protein